MIDKKFLIPEMYVQPVPKCDDCKIELQDTGKVLASYPPIRIFVCSKCNKEYNFNEEEVIGHWVWRTI